jgi:hypothetical protein
MLDHDPFGISSDLVSVFLYCSFILRLACKVILRSHKEGEDDQNRTNGEADGEPAALNDVFEFFYKYKSEHDIGIEISGRKSPLEERALFDFT